jgi:hypothetical protein
MIAIDDKDVPPDHATLTLAEFNEGIDASLYDEVKGDAIVEWYAAGGGPLLGRMWIWFGGAPTLLHPIAFNLETLRVRILWYAKHERLH